ncbi:Vacuolar protein-sorting-associated protein 27 [Pestalotiopsis sp. IQ-011]
MLKYQSVFVGGNHLWKMGHEGRLIGHTEVDDYRHQELLAMKDSQDANSDTVEVDCLALSVMDPGSTVLVMIVRKASDNGCSHRLGVDMQIFKRGDRSKQWYKRQYLNDPSLGTSK